MRAIIFSLLFLTSCAGYRRPESFQEKMNRFQARNQNPNPVPKYSATAPFKSFKKRTRGPASYGAKNNKKMPSTKKVYFMTLYRQYQSLGAYLTHSKAEKINHCPSFHSTFVTMNEERPFTPAKKLSYKKRAKNIAQTKSLKVEHFPELSLPMGQNIKGKNLSDLLTANGNSNYQVYFENALTLHLTKTYSELKEICDSGSSVNYYTYENLTRHIKSEGRGFTASQDGFRAYMKTTLFSNIALLKSLEKDTQRGRVPASATDDYSNIIEQLKADWSQNYFSKLARP